MTQTTDPVLSDVLVRLDRLSVAVESLTIDTRLFQVQVTEKLTAIDQRLERLEKRVESQDNRVWAIMMAIFTVIAGVAAKLAFFPNWPEPSA